jgi:hypothetical protein
MRQLHQKCRLCFRVRIARWSVLAISRPVLRRPARSITKASLRMRVDVRQLPEPVRALARVWSAGAPTGNSSYGRLRTVRRLSRSWTSRSPSVISTVKAHDKSGYGPYLRAIYVKAHRSLVAKAATCSKRY